MRNIYTLFLFTVLLGVVYAQNGSNNVNFIPQSDVPTIVLERQQTLFPTNFVSEWQRQEMDGMQNARTIRYIAKFEEDGRQGFSASYLPEGILIFKSEFMPSEIIPARVRLKVEKDYKDFTIQNAEYINLFNPKREIYLVKLLDNAQLQYVFYDTDGNEINKKNLPAAMLFLLK